MRRPKRVLFNNKLLLLYLPIALFYNYTTPTFLINLIEKLFIIIYYPQHLCVRAHTNYQIQQQRNSIIFAFPLFC